MNRKYNYAGALRSNGNLCNSKMVLSSHNYINLHPKQIEEQMYGGWEVAKGNPLTPFGRKSIHKSAPADISHIITISNRRKIAIVDKLGIVGGLNGRSCDIIADTSNKVR